MCGWISGSQWKVTDAHLKVMYQLSDRLLRRDAVKLNMNLTIGCNAVSQFFIACGTALSLALYLVEIGYPSGCSNRYRNRRISIDIGIEFRFVLLCLVAHKSTYE